MGFDLGFADSAGVRRRVDAERRGDAHEGARELGSLGAIQYNVYGIRCNVGAWELEPAGAQRAHSGKHSGVRA